LLVKTLAKSSAVTKEVGGGGGGQMRELNVLMILDRIYEYVIEK